MAAVIATVAMTSTARHRRFGWKVIDDMTESPLVDLGRGPAPV
jgi:hypothetical protein